MAHEFETGFFVTQPAWHGLGTVLPNAPSIQEALIASGLNWKAELRDMYMLGTGRVKDHKCVVRDTDGMQLGVVGNQFVPLQNDEAFDWFAPVIDSGEATIEAAGSLREGKRVWILASVKGAQAEVTQGDNVKSYILLAHGHDGTLAIRAGFTTVRVVCMNTLGMALNQDAKKLFKIRHTSGAKVNLEAAQKAFDMQRGVLKVQADTFRMLARKTCSKGNLIRYVREVLQPGAGDDSKAVVRHVDSVVDLAVNGRGAELSRGTLWGAYNAVTEHITHERGRSAESRVDSQWFGAGAQMATRALEVAVAMAEHAPTMVSMARQAVDNHASAAAELSSLLKRPARISPEATPVLGD